MTHKYRNILIHVVFSTSERRDLIPQETLPRLFRYFARLGRNHRIPVLAAGGTSNHSHLLIDMASAGQPTPPSAAPSPNPVWFWCSVVLPYPPREVEKLHID